MRFGKWVAALAALWMGAPLQAAWYEVRAPHFTVYSQGSADTIRRFVTDLERFDQAARKLLAYADHEGDDPNPLTVFVVENVNAVSKLCKDGRAKQVEDKACKFVAGFYDGRADGSVAFVPRSAGSGSPLALTAQTILFHEYAHHLMQVNSLAVYPAWYSEGFAEFMANVKLDRAGEVGVGLPAYSRAYSLLRERAIPVRDVLMISPSRLPPGDRSAFYGRAWLLTHYLTFAKGRDNQLTDYLLALNRGTPNAEAAAAAFGDLDVLDKEVRDYLNGKMSYLPVKVSDLPPERIRIRRLDAGEEALMPIRLQSRRSVNSETAPGVAAEARRLAEAWPGSAGAQLILAEAEFDAGNDDAAEAAADRALAVEPDMAAAMTFKAQAIMHRAQNGNHFDEPIWRAARGWLLKANKIENDAAWPLILYYRSFLQQGKKPTDNAVEALVRGVVLVPQDGGVRLMLVSQYLRDGKVKEAKALLTPLAFHPHAPPDNPARRLLDRIDARGADALSGWTTTRIETGPIELPPEEPAPKQKK